MHGFGKYVWMVQDEISGGKIIDKQFQGKFENNQIKEGKLTW